MFCTKCGHSNPDGAGFCSACGQSLSAAPQQAAPQMPQEPIMQQMPAAPQSQPSGVFNSSQPPYPPQGAYVPKKSRTGLVVGLTIGTVVLIGLAAVLLFVWPGFLAQSAPVNGFWYSEDRGEALEFRDNSSVRVYTTYDKYKGEYTYDQTQGMGVITIGEKDYRFAISEDGLYVESMGIYSQAKGNFDVKGFIDEITDSIN